VPALHAAGLTAAAVLLLSGCAAGGTAASPSPVSSSVAASASSTQATPPPPTPSPVLADACIIGAVPGRVDDDPTDATKQALEGAGFRVRAATAADAAGVGPAAADLLATRCAMMLSVYPPFANAMVAVAKEHPDLPVAAAGVTTPGTPVTLPANLARLGTDARAAAFVAGYLAAGASQTDRIGAVGLRNDPAAADLIGSFAAGARYRATQTGERVGVRGGGPVRLVADAQAAEQLVAGWSEGSAGAAPGVDVVFFASPGLADGVGADGVLRIGIGDRTGSTAEPLPGDALGWLVTDPSVSAAAATQQVADGVFAGGEIDGSFSDDGVRLVLGDVPDPLRADLTSVIDEVRSGRLTGVQ
jgi:hypothetical protein